MPILGLDISSHNGLIDFAKAVAAGVKFVILRATVGNKKDLCFAQNWAAAKKAGLLRAPYHYFWNTVGALAQAQLFWSVIKDDPGELPPVFDYEELYGIQDTATALGRVCNWLDYVETQARRIPMFYTSLGMWNAHGDVHNTWWRRFPLWAADYTPPLYFPDPWEDWTFHQFSSTGDGVKYGQIKGPIDLNYFNGTVEQLYQFAGATPPPQEVKIMAPTKLMRVGNASLKFAPLFNGPIPHGEEMPFGIPAGEVIGVYNPLYDDIHSTNRDDGSRKVYLVSPCTNGIKLPCDHIPTDADRVDPATWLKFQETDWYSTPLWIKEKYLIEDSSLNQTFGIPMRTTATMKLRSSPKYLASNVIGKVPLGQIVTVHEVFCEGINTWALIGVDQWVALYFNRVQYLSPA